MGTLIFKELVEFRYSEASHQAAIQAAWEQAPFIIDVKTGRRSGERWMEVTEWLRREFGPPAWPHGESPSERSWQVGLGTIGGWTWIDFSTKDQMVKFAAAFAAITREYVE